MSRPEQNSEQFNLSNHEKIRTVNIALAKSLQAIHLKYFQKFRQSDLEEIVKIHEHWGIPIPSDERLDLAYTREEVHLRSGEEIRLKPISSEIDRNVIIFRALNQQRAAKGPDFFQALPPKFSFPVYGLGFDEDRAYTEQDTLYGHLNGVIIGADDLLYGIEGVCLFNLFGRALIYQKFVCISKLEMGGETLTLQDNIDLWELDNSKLQRVSFIPSDLLPRTGPLKETDYKTIYQTLDDIDAGKYTLF